MTRARLRRRLARLETVSSPAVGAAAGPECLPAADESGDLAREMAAAFAAMVTNYREHFKLSGQEAVARVSDPSPAADERALNGPPDQVSWFDLDRIAQQDADLARRRWQEVKQAAREEIGSGHRAARALEGYDAQAWTRARFLAVRAELTEAWRPRNGLEQQLLDQLAQFQTMLWYWQETLMAYQALSNLGQQRPGRGRPSDERPRLSDAEAVEQAMGMVERCHRLYLRALKALQDQRRLSPRVIVRRAGQVNIGGQQINLAGQR